MFSGFGDSWVGYPNWRGAAQVTSPFTMFAVFSVFCMSPFHVHVHEINGSFVHLFIYA